MRKKSYYLFYKAYSAASEVSTAFLILGVYDFDVHNSNWVNSIMVVK